MPDWYTNRLRKAEWVVEEEIEKRVWEADTVTSYETEISGTVYGFVQIIHYHCHKEGVEIALMEDTDVDSEKFERQAKLAVDTIENDLKGHGLID